MYVMASIATGPTGQLPRAGPPLKHKPLPVGRVPAVEEALDAIALQAESPRPRPWTETRAGCVVGGSTRPSALRTEREAGRAAQLSVEGSSSPAAPDSAWRLRTRFAKDAVEAPEHGEWRDSRPGSRPSVGGE